MKVRIDVTDADIDSGGFGSMKCMVAVATNRYLDSRYHAGACGNEISIWDRSGRVARLNCETGELRGKTIEFDVWKIKAGPRPEPFSFEIDIPAEYLRIDVPALAEALTV